MKLPLLLCATLAVAQAAVPDPAAWFGHPIGVDRKLLKWKDVTGYFQALARASNQIRVSEFGRSANGRPIIVATIAAPETLRQLDRYRDIQRRLADPRLTTSAEAEPLIRSGKTVVLLTCSIHATEVASTHSAIEFAYRLLTEQLPHSREILSNDILLLVPSLNPDGLDLVTNWYKETLGTRFEGTSPPELYQKYVGHDNNRDWYIFSQPETRAVISALQNTWHPEIVYDVHQMGARGARLFLPPWLDPIEPNVDPVLVSEMNMIGTSMASDLTGAGFRGITINSTYDFWTPSRAYQSFHGGLRILSESASAKLATPIDLRFDQLAHSEPGYDPQQSSWNFLEPWKGGHWTLRDIINYQEAAFESCLHLAALHRESLLRNFYQVNARAVARTVPFAYRIPPDQADPGATRRLLETLAFGQVEIQKMPDGGHLIRIQQPASNYAKALLETQHYPDLRLFPGGPPRQPYDVTAHTLPLLFGVTAQPLDQLPPGHFPREEFTLFSAPPRSLSASDTDAWTTINSIWSAHGSVWRNSKTGDFSTEDRGADWRFTPRPRIALYRSWIPSIDEGWTRWLLDQFGFPYARVTNQDLELHDLAAQSDVIVFPDQAASDLDKGYEHGDMPDRFVGGIGPDGIRHLEAFASAGGTLLFLNRSTRFAAEHFHINARDLTEKVSATEFYSPGSLLRVNLRPGDPLALGLPEHITIWSEHSPAWDDADHTVARYPDRAVLASGWLLGEKVIAGRSALLNIPYGKGRIILFGMRPQYRAQSYQTFKLFFNALISSGTPPLSPVSK